MDVTFSERDRLEAAGIAGDALDVMGDVRSFRSRSEQWGDHKQPLAELFERCKFWPACVLSQPWMSLRESDGGLGRGRPRNRVRR